MQRTQNYNLCQWAAEDRILRSDFNADNQKIDAALAAAGNCHIVTGSYVGTGTWGSEHPNTLTFDFSPKVVIIMGQKAYSNAITLIAPAQTAYLSMDSRSVQVTWNETGVSWYQTNSGADYQLNSENIVYSYVAIG